MAGTTGEFEGLADAQLVELACGGDRAAFGVLFARHRSLLRGLCTRALAAAGAAEPRHAAPPGAVRRLAGWHRSQRPSWVGPHAGAAVALLKERISAPRPLTSEFIAAVLAAGGGRLQEVRITRLTQDTFYAIARVEGAGGVAELDARPSDAVALALAVGAPIVVSEQVFAVLDAAQGEPAYAERVARLDEFTEDAAAIATSTRGLWTRARTAQQPERPAS